MDADVNPGGVACLDEVDPGLRWGAGRITRRRGLAFLGATATALVSGLASACDIIKLAPCDLGGPACCGLATCIECDWEGSKDQYTCPDGWHQTYWTCIDSNNQSWVCGECAWATSTNCFEGPFRCSIWY